MEQASGRMVPYIIGICAVIALAAIWFLVTGPECGDGVCGNEEQCCNDCGCPTQQYCDEDTERCVGMACGDGRCETYEFCCEDCGCPAGMICQTATHRCRSQTSAMCGNKVCDVGESTTNCCRDCGCDRGYVCNLITSTCVRRGNRDICGDGVCDFGENVLDCCEDCPYCEEGTVCDRTTQRCIPHSISIKSDHAVSLFKIFLKDKGLGGEWVDSQAFHVEPEAFEGEPVLRVCTVLPEEAESFSQLVCARVTEEGRIVGYVQFW